MCVLKKNGYANNASHTLHVYDVWRYGTPDLDQNGSRRIEQPMNIIEVTKYDQIGLAYQDGLSPMTLSARFVLYNRAFFRTYYFNQHLRRCFPCPYRMA